MSASELNESSLNKDFLLNESKTFCMMPWAQLFMSPHGKIRPCCVFASEDFGDIKDEIIDTVNTDNYKNLRLNMLNDRNSPECVNCYTAQKFSASSYRTYANEILGKYFDETVTNTNIDGSNNSFSARRLDIRFSNICNFKCRTCNPWLSSSWAKEIVSLYPEFDTAIYIKPDESSDSLRKIIEQLDTVEYIYFAGGEPLLMAEHYVLLEELIKRNKTDTVLEYNTNASTLSYKDKDVLKLWEQFDNVIVYVSLDHYGKRAEYIRHGTKWQEVEDNIKRIKNLPNVKLGVNTVLSVFNYLTLVDFYEYLLDSNILDLSDYRHTHHICITPPEFNPDIISYETRQLATENIFNFINKLKSQGVHNISTLEDKVNQINSDYTWEKNKVKFLDKIKAQDKYRNEDFYQTFPELKELFIG